MTVINEDVLKKDRQWEVSVKKDPLDPQDLLHVKGIGASTKAKLNALKISTVMQLAELNPNVLAEQKGFGIASAEKLIYNARACLTERSQRILNEYVGESSSAMPAASPNLVPAYQKAVIQEKQSEQQISSDNLVFEPVEAEIGKKIEPKMVKKLELEPQKLSKEQFEMREKGGEQMEESDNIYEFEEEPKEGDYLEELDITTNFMRSIVADPAVQEVEPPNEEPHIFQQQQGAYSPSQLPPINQNPSKTTPTQKSERTPPLEPFLEELIQKNVLLDLKRELEEELKTKSYTLLTMKSSLFQPFKDKIDLLAFKMLKTNKRLSVLIILPIRLSMLKGTIVITKSALEYIPSFPELIDEGMYRQFLTDTILTQLATCQKAILEEMIAQGEMFQFCTKLVGGALTLKKSWYKKPLYFSQGEMQVKLCIDPLLVSPKESACAEKSLLFPYQRRSNLHAVSLSQLDSFLEFLEQKHTLRYTIPSATNDLTRYADCKVKFYKACQFSSIPFLSLGLVYMLVVFFQLYPVIAMFTSLVSGALFLYALALGFFWYRLVRVETALSKGLTALPHTTASLPDPMEFAVLQEKIEKPWLSQTVYEWFGKNEDYEALLETSEDEVEDEIPSKRDFLNIAPEQEDIRKQKSLVPESMASKYKFFIED